ncbi:MAG: hypothetical protein GF364_17105, partial [Candidatus Lokiarchaeota archaeon]|nr:hypothetical protein [Candidatus Lokiarchaeota archaeon]
MKTIEEIGENSLDYNKFQTFIIQGSSYLEHKDLKNQDFWLDINANNIFSDAFIPSDVILNNLCEDKHIDQDATVIKEAELNNFFEIFNSSYEIMENQGKFIELMSQLRNLFVLFDL